MDVSPSPAESPVSLGRSIRDAFKGESHDYTTTPLGRAVVLLAVPMVLEMAMESLFAISDVFWVSHLGKEAVAAVGLTESVMSLIYAIAIGLCFAATAIVARRIGEKEPERAAQAAGQIILIGIAAAALMGAMAGPFAAQILRAMGADSATIARGTGFTRLMLGGNITVFLLFLINAIFRGAGDAVVAMRTLWLANALNIVLCPCFIFGLGPFPRLGMTGAAVGTNLGRGIGVLFQLWELSGHKGRIRLHVRHLVPDWKVMAGIIRPSINGIGQLIISTTSWLGLFKVLALFGSSALAGYTIAIRLIVAFLLPGWGLANAGSTLVGQNLGAGRPDRAEAAVKMAVRYNVFFLGLVGVLYILARRPIVGCFTSDPAVLAYGVQALWIVSLGLPFFAAGMCYEGAFNGSGDTGTPTRLNFFCLWLGQIPSAWILARWLGLGALGVFISAPLAYAALALAGAWYFRRGGWKKKKI